MSYGNSCDSLINIRNSNNNNKKMGYVKKHANTLNLCAHYILIKIKELKTKKIERKASHQRKNERNFF